MYLIQRRSQLLQGLDDEWGIAVRHHGCNQARSALIITMSRSNEATDT
jgi:hypothetical protein